MWLPGKAFDLFKISRDTVDHQREELATVRSERDGLKAQLAVTQANFEWLRVRINSLEAERAQLIKKAYGIDVPVPEVVRTPSTGTSIPYAFFINWARSASRLLMRTRSHSKFAWVTAS